MISRSMPLCEPRQESRRRAGTAGPGQAAESAEALQRRVLEMAYLEDMPDQEIAEILGTTLLA